MSHVTYERVCQCSVMQCVAVCCSVLQWVVSDSMSHVTYETSHKSSIDLENKIWRSMDSAGNSNSPEQIQIRPRSQFEFIPRDAEESEFLGLVDFGGVTFAVELVIARHV